MENKSIRTIEQASERMNTHEAVCKERYDYICSRLIRLERILIGITGSILFILINLTFNVI